jgi:hypothetical protein
MKPLASNPFRHSGQRRRVMWLRQLRGETKVRRNLGSNKFDLLKTEYVATLDGVRCFRVMPKRFETDVAC